MDIRMVDLQTQYQRIKKEILASIETVLDQAAFINGPQVSEFSDALSGYLSAHVVPCANGTDALQIAMMALDLSPGDEVILPVHTYVATAEVIALLRLTPVFVDVIPETFNIDPQQIEKRITNKTKAIVPVHLYGQCADMEPILETAKKHGLFVIEDTAQALGAEYRFSNGITKKAGTMGTIGTTSFFPSKNLGCYGDGGAMITCDVALAEKMRMMANHGQRIKYHHDVIGVNSRLDTLQAAILNVKLKYLDEYATARRAVADFYDEELSDIEGLQIPTRSAFSSHVFHQYTLTIGGGRRDEVKKKLEESGIPTMIYYPVPLHLQKAYRQTGFGKGSFPVTERLSETVLSLPIHTEFSTEQLQYICDRIQKLLTA